MAKFNHRDGSGPFFWALQCRKLILKGHALLNVCFNKTRKVYGLKEFYGNRFLAAYNLTVNVAALHEYGHYITDLEAVNCRLHLEKNVNYYSR